MPSRTSLLALLIVFSACAPFGEEKAPEREPNRTAEEPVTTEEPATEPPPVEAPTTKNAPAAIEDAGTAPPPADEDDCLLHAICPLR